MITKGVKCSVNYGGVWYKECEAFSNKVFLIERGYIVYENSYGDFILLNGDHIFGTPFPRGIAVIKANAMLDNESYNSYRYSEIKDRYKICAVCGKTENLQLVTYSGDEFWACQEHQISCPDCGKVSGLNWGENYTSKLCQNCLVNYVMCHWCGGLNKKEEIFTDPSGLQLCKYCKENAHECEICGILVNGNTLCRNCRYTIIRSYDYVPEKYHTHGVGSVFYGIELEVDKFNGDTYKIAANFKKNFSKNETIFHIVSDGSLDEGLEFVFHPRTLKSWKIFEKDFPTYDKFNHRIRRPSFRYEYMWIARTPISKRSNGN